MATRKKNKSLLYIGTYSVRGSVGIYSAFLDPSAGQLELTGESTPADNPAFLALDPKRRYLFAVNELSGEDGKSGGSVSSFAIGGENGGLSFVSSQPSLGAHPCHLAVDGTGRYVITTNYTSGTIAVHPIGAEGALGAAVETVAHTGSGNHPERQASAHTHSVTLDPRNRFAYVADLGLDKILIYNFEISTGKLRTNGVPWVRLPDGSGPRHFAIHPNLRFAYVVGELNSTVTYLSYDDATGALRAVQTVSALPAEWSGPNEAADVHIHPNGRYLYASNRGHDSIAHFRIEEAGGTLTLLGNEPSGGRTPRNFAIDPSGNFLLAANQESDSIAVFRIDPQSGRLRPTDSTLAVPAPTCLLFATEARRTR